MEDEIYDALDWCALESQFCEYRCIKLAIQKKLMILYSQQIKVSIERRIKMAVTKDLKMKKAIQIDNEQRDNPTGFNKVIGYTCYLYSQDMRYR